MEPLARSPPSLPRSSSPSTLQSNRSSLGNVSTTRSAAFGIAPGPDGLCFFVWKYGGEFVTDALYDLCCYSQTGAPLAEDFNKGSM
eukprot:8217879-Pyramimonas_sp.AAC.1